MLSDSANADSSVQWPVRARLARKFEDTIADWDGRVIVAAVASNCSSVSSRSDAAAETGRR